MDLLITVGVFILYHGGLWGLVFLGIKKTKAPCLVSKIPGLRKLHNHTHKKHSGTKDALIMTVVIFIAVHAVLWGGFYLGFHNLSKLLHHTH